MHKQSQNWSGVQNPLKAVWGFFFFFCSSIMLSEICIKALRYLNFIGKKASYKVQNFEQGRSQPWLSGGQSWWASRWRVSANCALARTGGCLRGDVPPSEAGRFWNFDTEFTQFSDNFYAKFIPLEMFKYLWNNVYSLSSPFSSPPFPLSSLLFSFPFLFLFFFPFSFSLSFSLSLSSSFPFLFSLPFPLFSFLSPFFPFPIFALLPDFWCPGGQSAPLPPHWLRPWFWVIVRQHM